MRSSLLHAAGLAAAALLLSACATVTPVSGTYPPITPRQSQAGQNLGKIVRWGGILIKTTPEASQTCFSVMALPLAQDGRPETGEDKVEMGRFIACAPGFYDPVLYAEGREITFIGVISGVRKERVGQYEYPYPLLTASTVYLWPPVRPEPSRQIIYMNAGWGPWGWWGGPGWGWWYP